MAQRSQKQEACRLTHDQKLFLFQHLAELYPWDEIAQRFESTFGNLGKEDFKEWLFNRMRYYTAHRDAKKAREFIQQMRQHWLQGILEEPLANKRLRIQKLSRDYERLDPGDAPKDANVEDRIAWHSTLISLVAQRAKLLDQIAQEVGDKVERRKVDKDVTIAPSDWVVRLSQSFEETAQKETDDGSI